MLRSVLFASLVATSIGCIGSITGVDTEVEAPDEEDVDPPIDPPAPVTDVRLTIRDRGLPQAGVTVLFQDADDALVAEVVTGADGAAVAELPQGGNLTVIRTEPARPTEVFTYVGVKPGDRLELGRATAPTGTPVPVRVRVPAIEDVAITVYTPCGSGTGVAPYVDLVLDGCGAETDFYVTDGDVAFLRRATIAPTVDLSAELYRGSLATTLSATNLPSESTVVLAKHLETDLPYAVYASPAANAALPVEVTTPNLPGAEQLIVASVTRAGSRQRVARREPFTAAPSSLEVGSVLLPYVGAPTYDAATLSWQEIGVGTSIAVADLVVARLTATPLDRGAFVRTVAGPHTGSTFRVPALPGAYHAYDVHATDPVAVSHQIAKLTGGYDGVRARLFAVASLTDAVPMNGQATISSAPGAP